MVPATDRLPSVVVTHGEWVRGPGGSPSGDAEPADEDHLVGRIAKVTLAVPLGGPGEVMVPVRGGTEAYAAWAEEAIPKHTSVVIVGLRSSRSLTVTPFPDLDLLSPTP